MIPGAVISAPTHLFSRPEAERLAAANNATETDGWRYVVEKTGNLAGLVRVAIYDEHGDRVGTF